MAKKEGISFSMAVFYVVRHAHADWSPDEQRPLSDKGYRDAARVADILGQFPIVKIFTSPFLRARQTVAPLASAAGTPRRLNVPICVLPDLRERKLSGEPVEDFIEAVAATWRDFAFAHPGGESNAEAQQRMVGVVQRLQQAHRGKHIVLSTHGNLLALLLQHFDPSVDFEFWASLTIPDIYKLSIRMGGNVVIRRLWC